LNNEGLTLSTPSLMRFAGKLFGKSEAVERLVGSLTIDSSKIHKSFFWGKNLAPKPQLFPG